MRGSADADVIWQLNQLWELACGVLMEWAVDSLWFEGLFEKKKCFIPTGLTPDSKGTRSQTAQEKW